MKDFISQNEDTSDLIKDVSDDVSLHPLFLIFNPNKRLKDEGIAWIYNNRSRQVSIKTRKN